MTVRGAEIARIGRGLLLFVGVGRGDGSEDAAYLVDKAAGLRIFSNEMGRFDRSVLDEQGEVLLVSQFTLYADTRRGLRPSFIAAAVPIEASPLFDEVVQRFRDKGLRVATGHFQEMMQVSLINDGPATIWLDSADRFAPRSR